MNKSSSCHPIIVDVDQCDNFLLEIGIQSEEIFIAIRFKPNFEPIIFSLESYRKILQIRDTVEVIVAALENK